MNTPEISSEDVAAYVQSFTAHIDQWAEHMYCWAEVEQADQRAQHDAMQDADAFMRVSVAFPMLNDSERDLVAGFYLSAQLFGEAKGVLIGAQQRFPEPDEQFAARSCELDDRREDAYRQWSDAIQQTGILGKLTPLQQAVLFQHFGRCAV